MKTHDHLGDILVVDDTLANLQLLCDLLRAEGYKVRGVPTGDMALTAAYAAPPDLILLDINLPDLNGFEVCRRFKAAPETQNIPILFISAMSETEEKVQAFEAGGVDYVTKPFQFAEVRARVATHLKLKHLQDELRQTNQQLLDSNQKLLQACDEALHANRVKSTFLANISHELRTPLNAILGYSELLQEEAERDGLVQYLADLQRIHRSGGHLLTLINDILDLAKIEAGKMTFHLTTFDLKEIILSVAADERATVEKNHNTFTVDIDPTLADMVGDATKVKQVLFNLISNAGKFTSDGQVLLAARSIESKGHLWVEVRVADNGIGMSPEHVATLFDPFVQADESIATKYGGTGLGVAITKHFCELMGGTIHVSSELHVGTTFIITLPMHMPS